MAKIIVQFDEETDRVSVLVPESMTATEAHDLLALATAVVADRAGTRASLEHEIEARRGVVLN